MKCSFCGLEMTTADGCKCEYVQDRHSNYIPRIKVGEGIDSVRHGLFGLETKCPDCGAKEGYYHHINCDMEKCPICGTQAITCNCQFSWVYRDYYKKEE